MVYTHKLDNLSFKVKFYRIKQYLVGIKHICKIQFRHHGCGIINADVVDLQTRSIDIVFTIIIINIMVDGLAG